MKDKKKYADIWIKNHESGKDEFRIKYLHPYFQEEFGTIKNKLIYDIGCGWGAFIDFIDISNKYYGSELVTEFFSYVRSNFPDRNINLESGYLPDALAFGSICFDIVICSQVLHLVGDYKKSIKNIFGKLDKGGILYLVTFSDKSKNPLIESFKSIKTKKDYYINGECCLPSGLVVDTDIYFHKESDIEYELGIYSKYEKKYLGDFFVAYKCKKLI